MTNTISIQILCGGCHRALPTSPVPSGFLVGTCLDCRVAERDADYDRGYDEGYVAGRAAQRGSIH